jgi:hypothetical protein
MAVAGSLTLLAMVSATARAAEPGRSPRRYIPARGLVAYLEYEGLDPHAAAWQATAAYELLAKTPAGSMVLDLVKQLAGEWLESEFDGLLNVAETMTVAEVMTRRGFACAISQDERASHGMLVLKDIGRAENLKRLAHVRDVFNASPSLLFAEIERMSVRGRTIYRPDGDPVSVWFEGDDLVLVCSLEFMDVTGHAANLRGGDQRLPNAHKKHIGNILDCVEGRQLDVSKHPAYLAARAEGKDLKGFEPSGLWFVDTTGDLGAMMLVGGLDLAAELVSSQPARPVKEEKINKAAVEEDEDANDAAPAADDEIAKARRDLGLDGIKRIVGRWGFQGKALLSDIRIEAPAPRKSLLAWFDQPAFRTDRLPPLPAGTGTLLVGSVDLDGSYQAFANVPRLSEAYSIEGLAEFEKGLREATGLRLREDLLQSIGPTWCLFEIPSATRVGSRRGRASLRDHVLVASIKDADKVAKVLDKMLADDGIIRCGYLEIGAGKERELAGPIPTFERLPMPERGYRFTSATALTNERGEKVRPAFLIGHSVVVLAWDVEQARRVVAADLGRADRWQPAGEMAHALEGLPRELTFLSVTDNAESPLAQQLAGLPLLVQTWVNLMAEPDTDNAPIWSVLDVFGLPRPGGPHIRVDRSKIPNPDRIRQTLLPSVVATAVDDRGLRIIGREALPFLGIVNELKPRFRWTPVRRGVLPRAKESLTLTFPRFEWID